MVVGTKGGRMNGNDAAETDKPKPVGNRMKPVIILPVEHVSKDDIAELRANGFCVIEAKEPDSVRFMEPPPMGYSEQEKAAIKLCRHLLAQPNHANFTRESISSLLSWFFIQGSPLATVKEAKVATREKAKRT